MTTETLRVTVHGSQITITDGDAYRRIPRVTWAGGSQPPEDLGDLGEEIASALVRERVSNHFNTWRSMPGIGTMLLFKSQARQDAWATLRDLTSTPS